MWVVITLFFPYTDFFSYSLQYGKSDRHMRLTRGCCHPLPASWVEYFLFHTVTAPFSPPCEQIKAQSKRPFSWGGTGRWCYSHGKESTAVLTWTACVLWPSCFQGCVLGLSSGFTVVPLGRMSLHGLKAFGFAALPYVTVRIPLQPEIWEVMWDLMTYGVGSL